MEFKIKSGDIAKQKTPCLILGVFENNKLSGPADAVDKASDGHLSNILRKGDMSGDTGRTLMLYQVPGVDSERVLLVGCGKRKNFGRENYIKALAAAVEALNTGATTRAVCTLTQLTPEGMDLSHTIRETVTAAEDRTYRYDATKDDKKAPRHPLKRLDLWVSKKQDVKTAEKALQQGTAIAAGVTLAKELANRPGNVCTPTYLADTA